MLSVIYVMYAECLFVVINEPFMLSVIMLNIVIVMPSVIMLNAITLNVIILSVTTLCVMYAEYYK